MKIFLVSDKVEIGKMPNKHEWLVNLFFTYHKFKTEQVIRENFLINISISMLMNCIKHNCERT